MIDMKKRIIATVLVVVMLVLTLASCGTFSFADENLDNYVSFNYERFMEELKKIEIEDGDFTTDESVRLQKIDEAIYAAMADTVIAEAKNYEADKLETGVVGERDIVYFCYYATDADGNVFFYSDMKESAITATSTASAHVVELAADNDKLLGKIAEAVAGFDFGTDGAKKGYSILVAGDFATDAEKRVQVGDTVVVSYDRENNVYGEDGQLTGKDDKKANFEVLEINAESTNILAKKIYELLTAENSASNTVNVGSAIKIPSGTEGTSTTTTIEIEDNGVKYAYSNVTVQWKLDKTYANSEVTFKYTPYDDENKVEPDGLHTDSTDAKIDLKDKELTYHVFPVYRLALPNEINAVNILRYAFADKISATSFEVFENDAYKHGETAVKAIVEQLVKLYDEEYDSGSELANLLKAYDDAQKAVKDAGDDVTAEQEKARDDAQTAYVVAQRAAILEKINLIAAAANTANAEETVAAAVIEQYKKDTRHSLREKYDTHITEAVESAVYNLIFNDDNIVQVIAYPEELVEEFYVHLYESYEHEFYKGKYKASSSSTASSESNYSHYNGDLEAYLLVATGATANKTTVEAAIEQEAKDAIAPLLKLYAVSKRLDAEGVAAKVVEYIQDDIDAGAYDAEYADDATEKQIKKAQEAAEENKAEALENGAKFLVDEEVFKEYKKALGSSAYRTYEQQYGEINIRASLQFNRLFYYLTSTELAKGEDDEHPHAEYVDIIDADGNVIDTKLKFRNITYTLKAEDAE